MNSYKPIVHSVIAFNIYTRDTYTYGTKIPFSQIAFTFFSQLEYTSCLCTNQMIPGKDTCTCYFNIYGTNPRMRTVGEDQKETEQNKTISQCHKAVRNWQQARKTSSLHHKLPAANQLACLISTHNHPINQSTCSERFVCLLSSLSLLAASTAFCPHPMGAHCQGEPCRIIVSYFDKRPSTKT